MLVSLEDVILIGADLTIPAKQDSFCPVACEAVGMATTERVLEILGLFQSRAVWTAPQLAERLRVTERTVRRDIERLRDLGYAIGADRGPAGGYRLRRGSVVPPLLLTDDEAVAVALCLRTAGLNGLAGQGTADPALRAATKLEAMLPAVARDRVRALAEAIRLPDLAGEGVDTELLTGLAAAVTHTRQVRLAYVDRFGNATDRRVEPHRLIAWSRRWYLSAYDLDRADWRTLRLDRITDVHVTTFAFARRPEEPDPLVTLASRAELSSYRHRVELLVQASLAELEGYATYVSLEAVTPTTTRMISGADDPDRAAYWLLRLEHPFHLVGDEAVRAALSRLSHRLAEALA